MAYTVTDANNDFRIKKIFTDETIRAVWMQSSNGSVFSRGTDFRYLNFLLQQNAEKKGFEYLRSLNELSVLFGKYNKPLFININGEAQNSAASMVGLAPFTLTSDKSSWRINQINYGYTPDCGASYVLSRMPFEIGLYLALTGQTIYGDDLQRIGIAKQVIIKDENIKENLLKAHQQFRNDLTSEQLYGNEFVKFQAKDRLTKELFNNSLQQEIKQRILDTQGVKPENSRLAMAEILYKKKMMEYANRDQLSATKLQFKNQNLINHLSLYEEKIFNFLQVENLSDPLNPEFNIPADAINRCFSAGSIEEIIERLQMENSDWARKTISNLEGKSLLSLKLTFRLIRDAQNSQWFECYQREFRVACRRLKDSDLQKALQIRHQQNSDPKTSALAEFWKEENKKCVSSASISDSKLDRYFAPLSEDLKIAELDNNNDQIQVKPNALYPVKAFYDEYTDVIRHFLNQENVTDTDLRECFDFDVKSFLFACGIDPRKGTLDIPVLREKIFKFEEQKRQLNVLRDRLTAISRDPQTLSQYYTLRSKYIDQFFSTNNNAAQSKVEATVNNAIKQVFEEYFDARLDKLKEISQAAAVEEKQKFFLNLRQLIFNSRLTVPDSKFIQNAKELEGLNYLLFFPDKNDQNMLETIHTEMLQRTPLGKILQEISHIEKDSVEEGSVQTPLAKDRLITSLRLRSDKIDKLLKQAEFDKNADKLNFMCSNQKKTSKDARLEEYIQRYGDPFDQETINKYYDNLIACGNKSKDITNFLQSQSNDQIKEYLRTSKDYTYRDLSKEFISNLEQFKESSKTHLQQQGQQLLKENLQLNASLQLNSELTSAPKQQNKDELLTLTQLLDLTPSTSSTNQGPTTKFFGTVSDSANNDEDYLRQLKNYLNLDSYLTEVLEPVLKPQNNKAIEKIRIQFVALLLEIYKGKLKQILKKEIEHYKVVSPLLTQDGQNALFNNGSLKPLKIIDDYISQNLQFDLHNFLSSHIFFTFSQLGLTELDEIFKKLYNVTRKTTVRVGMNTDSEEEIQQQQQGDAAKGGATSAPAQQNTNQQNGKIKNLLSLLNESGIQTEKAEDINEMVNYLNNLTEVMCVLNFAYKDKLIFPEDRLLEAQNRAKYIKERDYDDLSFSNYVLTSFGEKQQMEAEIAKLESNQDNKQSEKYLLSHERKNKFQVNKFSPDKSEDYNLYFAEDVRRGLEKMSSNQQRHHLIKGSLLYIEKLDLLTQKLIHGKDHFIQDDLGLDKELCQIPDLIKNLDLRKSIHQWMFDKIKSFVKSLFEIRYQFEKKLTRHDLMLLDLELIKHLQTDTLKETILYELEQEIAILRYLGDAYNLQQQNQMSDLLQQINYSNLKKRHDALVQNPEAEKKYLAFAIMLQNKYSNMKRKLQYQTKDEGLIQQNLIQEMYFKPKDTELTDQQVQKLYREVLGKPDFSAVQEEVSEIKLLKESQLTKELVLSVKNLLGDQTLKLRDPSGQIKEELDKFMKQVENKE